MDLNYAVSPKCNVQVNHSDFQNSYIKTHNRKVRSNWFTATLLELIKMSTSTLRVCSHAIFLPPFHSGYLSLLVNQMWREHWCCVSRGSLHFYHDKGDIRTSLPSLPLHGCEVVPGLGPKHPFAFRILRNSTEMAALEVNKSFKWWQNLGMCSFLYCIENVNIFQPGVLVLQPAVF